MPSVAPMSAGFKQVAVGGYLTVLSTLANANMYAAPVTSGSGGAATIAAPAAIASGVYGAMNVGVGASLKDMGSVAVSSSRVFRKFKAVGAATAGSGNNLGDVTTSDGNFGTFYLEVVADGGDLPDAKKSLVARSY